MCILQFIVCIAKYRGCTELFQCNPDVYYSKYDTYVLYHRLDDFHHAGGDGFGSLFAMCLGINTDDRLGV